MKIRFFLIFIFIGNIIYATPQSHDAILYNGKRYWLLTHPLEGYFLEHPDKRPEGGVTSAQWRGYNALFGISQNKLYAISINVNGKNVIEECLGESPDVYLNWWNGMLEIIDGEIVYPGNYGIGVIYEYYKLIEIKNGNIVREYRLNSSQYKKYDDIDFELYIKTRKINENPELSEIFENRAIKEYEEIINELNDRILPNELVEYIFIKYDLNEKFNNKIEINSQDNIENKYYSKINKKVYIIIIGGVIGIIGIILLIKKIGKMHNVA
jgi:hypothetical protein